jgi:hypothetical protein
MSAATAWRTDEPCPVCGNGLTLLDDGLFWLRAKCRLCGYGETWTSEKTAGGDQ